MMKKKLVNPDFRKLRRDAASGRFSVIGVSPDGIEILMPIVKPKSFTLAQLDRVMRDLQEKKKLEKRTG